MEFSLPDLPSPSTGLALPDLPDSPSAEAQDSAMEMARFRHAGDEESAIGYLGRRSIPVASTGVQLYEGVGYGQALRRIRAGRPQEQDFDTVAEYEQLQKNTRERQESFGGALLESAAHMPAIAGEFALAGPALRGAGFLGRTAIGAALPSMGAYTGTVERYNEGRGLPRAAAEATGLAVINAAILGQLQGATQAIHGVGVGPYLGRIGAAGGIGVLEQAAADVVTSGIGLTTGYGTIGDLIGVQTDARGQSRLGEPRYGAALQHAAVQALTFGAFGALHGRPRDQVTDAFARAVQAERRAGHTEAEAAQNVRRINDLIEGEHAEQEITRAEARQLFEGMPDHLRRYGEAVADATLPERRSMWNGWNEPQQTSLSDIAARGRNEFDARWERLSAAEMRREMRLNQEEAARERSRDAAADRWMEEQRLARQAAEERAAEVQPTTPNAESVGVKPPEPVEGVSSAPQDGVPFMVTRAMEQQLRDLGYEQASINAMLPKQAWDIISAKKPPDRPGSTETSAPPQATPPSSGGVGAPPAPPGKPDPAPQSPPPEQAPRSRSEIRSDFVRVYLSDAGISERDVNVLVDLAGSRSLRGTGESFGISGERVRQIKEKALEKVAELGGNAEAMRTLLKVKDEDVKRGRAQKAQPVAEAGTKRGRRPTDPDRAQEAAALLEAMEQIKRGEIADPAGTFAAAEGLHQRVLAKVARKLGMEVERDPPPSKAQLLEMLKGYASNDPNILYSTGERGQDQRRAGASITPFQLVASINRKLRVPGYSAAQAGERPDAKAAALLREDATVTAPRGQGNPKVAMEEAAHLLGERGKLEVNPLKLPGDVAEGFRQFDAPNAGLSRRSMQEGFAQWVVRRTAGELEGLTPAQEAAGRFAEQWIKDKGLDKPLNELRDLWQQYSPSARELLSTTGRAAEPIRTTGEKAEDVASGTLSWVQDNIDTHLGPLLRAEKYAERTRGRRLEPQDRASTWLQQLMYGDKPLAGRMEKEGVLTVEGGKWKKIGQSLDEIVAGHRPEWLQPTEQGGGSRADAFHFSRHVLSEHELGRKTVTQEQVKLAEKFMEESRADPEFFKWAQGFSERLHEAFSATRRALASPDIHFLSSKQVENWIKKYPVYTDMASVHERSSSQLKGRQNTESGEQRIAPLVAYKKRLLITSAIINEQLKSNAVAKLLQMDGMGRFALRQREALKPAGEAKLRELAERLGETDATLRQMLAEVGEEAVGMFQRTPWKGDEGVWNWRGPEGWVSFKIKERALYDLLTGQQLDASMTARTLNAFANLAPIRALTQTVKFGATTASAAFQVMNVGRDVKTFVSNTVDMASAGRLPEAYARIYAYEWNRLLGRTQTDKAVERYFRDRGDQFREFAFDRSRPESSYSQLQATTWQGFGRFFKDVAGIMGAGEHGPRFQEMLNRYKQLGWDEARLKREEPPVWMQMEVMNAAQEVTTPFPRLGVVAREANKIIPFLGPHIAGMSKYVRNWRENRTGAMVGLGGLLATSLVHWLMVKDEDWYRELDARDRYDNIVIPIAGRLYRFPRAQGLEVPVGGAMIAMLDAAAQNNPDIGGLVEQSLGAVAGPGLERPLRDLGRGDVAGAAVQGGMQMFGPAGTVAADLVRNQNFRGTPIIPRRDEDLPGNLMRHAVPYAAEQLTGGRGSLRGLTAGMLPLREVRNARRSVDEYYERLQRLEGERRLAQRQGQRYENESEYRRLHAAEERMQALSRRLRGDILRGRRVVAGEEPSEEQKEQLRSQMVSVARRALQR